MSHSFLYLVPGKSGENVTATLRLLRLLVKYGPLGGKNLQDVINEGFASTPCAPWKDIIPQVIHTSF